MYDKFFGKCTAPRLKFLDNFAEEIKHLNFQLYFDNLFTSVNLLLELSNRGYGGTGTLRENKLNKQMKAILLSKKQFDKQVRGESTTIGDIKKY